VSGDAPGIEPLAGYTIGITAARRREEFGAALQRRGATVVYAPAIKIVPLADDSQLRDATERCLAAPLDIVVATTGIGFRGWIDAADTWGLTEQLTEAIDRSTVLARGPKARGAIRASGLRETWSPESESSSEVLAYLVASGDLEGRRIAVQLHGEPLPDVVQTLRLAGAEVIEVPVYRWVPPEDAVPLRRLIQSVGVAGLDAVAFTSAPAAASFLRAADEQGCGDAIRAALRGPVVAAEGNAGFHRDRRRHRGQQQQGGADDRPVAAAELRYREGVGHPDACAQGSRQCRQQELLRCRGLEIMAEPVGRRQEEHEHRPQAPDREADVLGEDREDQIAARCPGTAPLPAADILGLPIRYPPAGLSRRPQLGRILVCRRGHRVLQAARRRS
jgi:uroporphyrinogen-III synthase